MNKSQVVSKEFNHCKRGTLFPRLFHCVRTLRLLKIPKNMLVVICEIHETYVVDRVPASALEGSSGTSELDVHCLHLTYLKTMLKHVETRANRLCEQGSSL
ncbi:hypothetical protein TcWFU_001686 [Taenia crassiceps]|uniref:Uncharacterized protein n=1 Tax=Taenia crassiceps TaxID=6207 RepID=A0ABR4Q7W4_9CEST